MNWAEELGQNVKEDLDENSANVLNIRIEKLKSSWDDINHRIVEFSNLNNEVTNDISCVDCFALSW